MKLSCSSPQPRHHHPHPQLVAPSENEIEVKSLKFKFKLKVESWSWKYSFHITFESHLDWWSWALAPWHHLSLVTIPRRWHHLKGWKLTSDCRLFLLIHFSSILCWFTFEAHLDWALPLLAPFHHLSLIILTPSWGDHLKSWKYSLENHLWRSPGLIEPCSSSPGFLSPSQHRHHLVSSRRASPSLKR